MTNYSFTRVSGNLKTGPIPVSMTQRSSCPDTCGFKGNGCYAENFRVRNHWNKLDNGGKSLAGLTTAIKKLPKGQLWRHNVAGDLPHTGGAVDEYTLSQIVAANRGRRGFSYTHHKPDIADNAALISKAIANGFTVNVSSDNVGQAIEYRKLYRLPTVTVIPDESFWQGRASVAVADQTVVRCPAETRDDITCASCGACAVSSRSSIIGFTAHGQSKKKAAATAAANLIARG